MTNRISYLIQEAHRRSLWQVFTIYVAVSWGAYQLLSALPGLIGLPAWVPSISVALFLIGLPIVLATAFVQEGGPRRAEYIDPTLLPNLEPEPVHIRLFTWKRALAGGFLAFAVLFTTAGSYAGLRKMGVGPFASLLSAGKLSESTTLLLADFRNRTSDTTLSGVITEALRVDLLKATSFRIADPTLVRSTLQRMQRDVSAPLTEAAALEVAQRANLKAVIGGEVAPLGKAYVLTAHIKSVEGGETLAAFRETARSDAELIEAVDKLSRAIRTRIGESLKSVNSSRPLEQVTTSSLAALRVYSEAVRLGGGDRAIALLNEAIALDSGFAMAYRKRGAYMSNSAKPTSEILLSYRKAYELRERLTPIEQALTEADYHNQIEQDGQQAIAAYQRALSIDSLYGTALNNLTLVAFETRNFELAEWAGRRGIALPAATASQYINLVMALLGAGKFEEGRELSAQFEQRFPRNRWPALGLATIERMSGNFDKVDSIANSLLERPGDARLSRRDGASLRVGTALTRGQLGRAVEARKRWISEVATPTDTVLATLNEVFDQVLLAAQPERGREAFARAVKLDEEIKAPPEDHPYHSLAYAAALLDDREAATRYTEKWRAVEASIGMKVSEDMQVAALARLDAASGKLPEAIARLKAALPTAYCQSCLEFELGELYARAGDADQAIASYERYFKDTSLARALNDGHRHGPALLRLGELYDAKGDRAKAAQYYAKVLDLWKDADPIVQARLVPVRQRLQLFARER